MADLKSTLLFMCFIIGCHLGLIKAHGGGDGHDDGETVDLRSRGLILVKIWCLIILLASTFAGGMSPYFFRWNEAFLLLGTQFAGGVFLGTSMMHFLSDSNATFNELSTKTYPFAFMLACTGYLLTMLGDCVVIYVARSKEREAKVLEVEEGGRTPQEHAHEIALESNPIFLKTSNVGDTILLIIALCFHSVFEGIAIGVSGNISIFSVCVFFGILISY